jgi:4-amino-4-deoxy-L-arabinose transferase-like glycosyltransferase
LFIALYGAKGRRAGSATRFMVGYVAALLPAGWLLLLAPEQTVFGNLGYPALNTAYRVSSGFTEAMDFGGKVEFALVEVLAQPGNLCLAALFLFGCLCGPMALDTREGRLRRLMLLVLPFLLLGAFAATPSWYQYFYAMVPFAVLGGVVGLALLAPRKSAASIAGWALLAAAVLASAHQSLPEYRTLSNLRNPAEWVPNVVHSTGVQVAEAAQHGRVVTLAPIYPLEGGATIHPAFASGPFNWRSAEFVPGEERADKGLVGPDELAELLEREPADAVLTGTEKTGEGPLRSWAAARGFTERPLSSGLLLQVDSRAP